jgi:hypothetical protein
MPAVKMLIKKGWYLIFKVAIKMMGPMDFLHAALEIMEKDVCI